MENSKHEIIRSFGFAPLCEYEYRPLGTLTRSFELLSGTRVGLEGAGLEGGYVGFSQVFKMNTKIEKNLWL